MLTDSGSSSWLTVYPILEHSFQLYKDLSLCYGIAPFNTSCSYLPVWNLFSIDHAMVCPFRDFPTIKHIDEVRDLTASLLTEVCHNVATELSLQPITSESETFSLTFAKITIMILIWILWPEVSGV